ncbi:hypothetical protein OKS80_18195 [Aeromonas veronii]|uniref:hypothetical protein n=1 Tax=Aeromonas veronii TaxID=654 RepID=UPI00226D32BD|nr:hypothetical protein [Aeromonas veronii]MCX9114832.1 hypothetical protein [Aeromonas veronii]
MDAYVIIGGPNTRKSSVTRSLTGCFNRSVRNILLQNGTQIQIYARVSSLQESETTAQDFIAEVNKTQCQSVVFCLWPTSNPCNPIAYPDATAYLAAFNTAGWNIVNVAVLGNTPAIYPNQMPFLNSQTNPINQTAQAVRVHFGWQ